MRNGSRVRNVSRYTYQKRSQELAFGVIFLAFGAVFLMAFLSAFGK